VDRIETAAARPQGDAPAVELRGVSRRFTGGARPVVALAGIDAQVRAGRITGLIGPDAAGKTTLLRIIAGLLQADAGCITVFGRDVGREALAVQAELSYMPQRFGLYEDLSVQENLDLYADLRDLQPQERPARYAELLAMTGLRPFTGRLAGRLSGGMKQKLGVACALVRAPRLLLLDEPTVGVDPVSRQELWEIIQRFAAEAGTTVLISTSYLDEAERCDEVILLRDGHCLGQGRAAAFSDRLRGRTFLVTATGRRRRELQQALRGHPGVLDAVVQGRGVRILTDAGAGTGEPPPLGEELQVEPVPPRFEDAFIDIVTGLQAQATGPGFGAAGAAPPAAVADRTATDEVVIEVNQARRMFGQFCAVRDISFSVTRGEIFGLLGANGAGKTTTFRMLCGLLPASSGSLRVAGRDLRTAAASARERLGYMAQKFSLYRDLSVIQNLSFLASAYGLQGRRRRERLAWALDSFQLRPYRRQTAGLLPLGFQQRLSLAAALLHEPDILFLDEPTSGVDPLARREFWWRISALARQGVTVLVTTHYMEEAEYCDRLAIMADGRILAIGSPAEIKQSAADAGGGEATMEAAFIALVQGRAAAGHG